MKPLRCAILTILVTILTSSVANAQDMFKFYPGMTKKAAIGVFKSQRVAFEDAEDETALVAKSYSMYGLSGILYVMHPYLGDADDPIKKIEWGANGRSKSDYKAIKKQLAKKFGEEIGESDGIDENFGPGIYTLWSNSGEIVGLKYFAHSKTLLIQIYGRKRKAEEE
jgi:hypothetical protein